MSVASPIEQVELSSEIVRICGFQQKRVDTLDFLLKDCEESIKLTLANLVIQMQTREENCRQLLRENEAIKTTIANLLDQSGYRTPTHTPNTPRTEIASWRYIAPENETEEEEGLMYDKDVKIDTKQFGQLTTKKILSIKSSESESKTIERKRAVSDGQNHTIAAPNRSMRYRLVKRNTIHGLLTRKTEL
jgi:hypothetical protein